MESFDYKNFYNKQPDYEAFRNDPLRRYEYEIAVNWKADNLCKLIPKSLNFSNILEIGCAFGILLNKVSEKLVINDVTGIDISDENIKKAGQLFPRTFFFQGTVDNIQLLLNAQNRGKFKYDLVLLSDIVEHIPDDIVFLRTVAEYSNYVLLNLPLEKCLRNLKRKYGINDPSGHLRNYDSNDAKILLDSAGFEVISSNISNAHFNTEHFQIYKNNRTIRVRKKTFIKRIFWTLFYKGYDLLKVLFPQAYIKIFGSNYFALLKSKPDSL